MRALRLLLPTIFISAASVVNAQELQCLNLPKTAKYKYTDKSLMNSLHNASDPLSVAFKKTQYLNTDLPKQKQTTTVGSTTCFLCLFGKNSNNGSITNIEKLTKKISRITPKIKPECMRSSLQREVGNTGYLCDDKGDTTKKFNNNTSAAPCIDEKVADFTLYALNQAIECMSPPNDPIDPRVILKKINNETGFNFHIGYDGGVGIGQLTSNPVKDISGWFNKSGKFQKGNASYVLEDMLESKNPACEPFKKMVGIEAQFPPPLPKDNYCKWVSVGEGVGRSLIYGLGYYIYVRDKVIKPRLKETAPALLKNKDIVTAFTLVGYGPDGPFAARSIISGMRLNNKTSFLNIHTQLMKKNDYYRSTQKKMNELLEIQHGKDNFNPADISGDTCITR